MTTYKFYEKQNLNSMTKGEKFTATDIKDARRKANQMQFFQGTVLEITTETGTTITVKEHGRWKNVRDDEDERFWTHWSGM